MPGPGGHAGAEAHLLQQRDRFSGDVFVVRHQLQMAALAGVGDAAPGEKGAPEKGRLAAVLLQHAEVDMVDQRAVRVIAEGGKHAFDALRVRQREGGFRAAAAALEFKAEGPLHQPRQALGKGGGSGDDADLPRGKLIAEQKHAVGLRHRAAVAVQRHAAELCLGVGGKGHDGDSSFRGQIISPYRG